MLNARLGKYAALAALLVAIAAPAAFAGSPLGIGTAEPSFPTTGMFGGFLGWVNEHQQAFYRALTESLKAMREDPSRLATLVGLSFAYGVFHAAGPGHGKAVISSYMIANETELKRGVGISFVSSAVQALVAIAVVGTAYLVLRGTGITLTNATDAMELASYGLIIAFGLWLLVRKLRSVFAMQAASATLFAAPVSTSVPRTTTGLRFEAIAAEHSHAGLAPEAVCPDCGMTHIADPRLLSAKEFRLRDAWSAIVAVGLRPCSGALLVMTFAILNGLYLGGVLSVFAMALGTAITVSLLATLAVSAKSFAVRLSGPGSPAARKVASAIEIGGALLVIVMGVVLLAAALQS
ncbi:nickel/cobalt transporter [Ciceribacter sp. RN22]|uniref:nickel/cobalt transporter n=1 Tax=Ciceribacter sp. RN22 TaxID=2954932 RepID=UPI002092D748|nr:nickel/cobalt transporter [Ciceribacter sp. RN22]MCO6180025.1 nickel/cobalt transporter [Ciceribacter sp. RN22]